MFFCVCLIVKIRTNLRDDPIAVSRGEFIKITDAVENRCFHRLVGDYLQVIRYYGPILRNVWINRTNTRDERMASP